MKQVEEEYYKGIESNQAQGNLYWLQQIEQLWKGDPNKLYPLTPAKNMIQTAKTLEKSTQQQIDIFLNNMASGSVVEGGEDIQEKKIKRISNVYTENTPSWGWYSKMSM
jgi:hypothetical protein